MRTVQQNFRKSISIYIYIRPLGGSLKHTPFDIPPTLRETTHGQYTGVIGVYFPALETRYIDSRMDIGSSSQISWDIHTHRERNPKHSIYPKTDFIYHFPTKFEANRFPFGFKSIFKCQIKSDFIYRFPINFKPNKFPFGIKSIVKW